MLGLLNKQSEMRILRVCLLPSMSLIIHYLSFVVSILTIYLDISCVFMLDLCRFMVLVLDCVLVKIVMHTFVYLLIGNTSRETRMTAHAPR